MFALLKAQLRKAGRWELAAETLDLVEPGLITYNCVARSEEIQQLNDFLKMEG